MSHDVSWNVPNGQGTVCHMMSLNVPNGQGKVRHMTSWNVPSGQGKVRHMTSLNVPSGQGKVCNMMSVLKCITLVKIARCINIFNPCRNCCSPTESQPLGLKPAQWSSGSALRNEK